MNGGCDALYILAGGLHMCGILLLPFKLAFLVLKLGFLFILFVLLAISLPFILLGGVFCLLKWIF
jgi:hypothetical protein